MNSASFRVLPFSRTMRSAISSARSRTSCWKRDSACPRSLYDRVAQSFWAARDAAVASRTCAALATRTSPTSLPLPGSYTARVPCAVTEPWTGRVPSGERPADLCIGSEMDSAMGDLPGEPAVGYAAWRALSTNVDERKVQGRKMALLSYSWNLKHLLGIRKL